MNENATTPPAPDEPGQMSEEQVREYLEKVRTAPADQVVSDVISVVLNAASAKIGRRDGRLLIDLAAVIVEHTRPHLPDDVATQVYQVLGQLRLGQVQAEREPGEAEPNDLATAPASPAQGAPPAQEQPQPATSKLWIPGRD